MNNIYKLISEVCYIWMIVEILNSMFKKMKLNKIILAITNFSHLQYALKTIKGNLRRLEYNLNFQIKVVRFSKVLAE